MATIPQVTHHELGCLLQVVGALMVSGDLVCDDVFDGDAAKAQIESELFYGGYGIDLARAHELAALSASQFIDLQAALLESTRRQREAQASPPAAASLATGEPIAGNGSDC